MSIVPLPADPMLPQLVRMLDPGAMAPVLARSLEPAAAIAGVRIAYVSYDPGESALVQYEVPVNGSLVEAVAVAVSSAHGDPAARATGPEAIALAGKVRERIAVPAPIRWDDDLAALIHWPPLDPALPGLAEPPQRLRELLEAAGLEPVAGDDVPELVHYKPGRRAVFRFGHHVVKIYADEKSFTRSVGNLRAVSGLPFLTATCEAVVPQLLIQAQSLLPGERAGGAGDAAAGAARLLRVLHASELEGLRPTPARYWLRSAARSALLLSSVHPGIDRRLRRLLARLEETVPEDGLVPVHGDFHARQLLLVGGELALIDFDRMSMASAALDLATYVSFVTGPEDLATAASVLDELVESYGSRPPGIGWHLAGVLLRRARIPFRRLHDNWPEEIELRVAAAEAALGL